METLNLQFIKGRRNARKLSMQDMANMLDMSHASTYMKYENGDYAFKARHLPSLAEALDCKIVDFFTRDVAVSAIN